MLASAGCPQNQGLTLTPCALSIQAGDGSVSSLGHQPDLPPHSPPLMSVPPDLHCSLDEPRSERTHLQSLLQKSCTTIRSIGKFIREAPVTNKEYKGLEKETETQQGQCHTAPTESKLPAAPEPAQKNSFFKGVASCRTRTGYMTPPILLDVIKRGITKDFRASHPATTTRSRCWSPLSWQDPPPSILVPTLVPQQNVAPSLCPAPAASHAFTGGNTPLCRAIPPWR